MLSILLGGVDSLDGGGWWVLVRLVVVDQGWWCATQVLTCPLLWQIGVLEAMPEGKKGGRRITKQGQQDCDRIAKEIFESKQ